MDLVYTVTEAAELMKWSEGGVYEAIADGRLGRVPHTGRKILISRIALERFAAGLPPATGEQLEAITARRLVEPTWRQYAVLLDKVDELSAQLSIATREHDVVPLDEAIKLANAT